MPAMQHPARIRGYSAFETLVRHLMEVVPDDHPTLKREKEFMLGDARTIRAKIAGAEGGDLFDIRMENAGIIRKAARDLITGTTRVGDVRLQRA